jgi:hypothetical protein
MTTPRKTRRLNSIWVKTAGKLVIIWNRNGDFTPTPTAANAPHRALPQAA